MNISSHTLHSVYKCKILCILHMHACNKASLLYCVCVCVCRHPHSHLRSVGLSSITVPCYSLPAFSPWDLKSKGTYYLDPFDLVSANIPGRWGEMFMKKMTFAELCFDIFSADQCLLFFLPMSTGYNSLLWWLLLPLQAISFKGTL